MKLQNPILITLNNTLHIKADNLEPVEVDSSCVRELETEAGFIFGRTETLTLRGFYDAICKGLGISELSDRIEVRNCTKYINTESYSVPVVCKRAFLLPVKEEKTIKFKVGETLKLGFQDDTNGVLMEYTGNDILFVVRKDSVDYKISSKRVVELDNKEAYTMKEVEKAIDNLPISGAFRNTLKRLLAITLKK